jgi:hypothetical protein
MQAVDELELLPMESVLLVADLPDRVAISSSAPGAHSPFS